MDKVAHILLLVDDEAPIRQLAAMALENAGYVALQAHDPNEAAAIWSERRKEISLLLCDVFLPGLSGPELAAELVADRPDLAVVFMSGAGIDAAAPLSNLIGRRKFLQKPFTSSHLLEVVAEALNARGKSLAGKR